MRLSIPGEAEVGGPVAGRQPGHWKVTAVVNAPKDLAMKAGRKAPA